MAEYISRDDVLKKAKSSISVPADNEWDCGYNTAMAEMQEFIKQLPSADVQPVIHAYWIELPKALNPNENPCKCSNCGHILSFMNGYPKSKYCDECGAKMDIIYEDDKIRAIKVTG